MMGAIYRFQIKELPVTLGQSQLKKYLFSFHLPFLIDIIRQQNKLAGVSEPRLTA